jgi:hypothetical protein
MNVAGSLVLDIDGNRLDARFLTSAGAVADSFTVIKGPPVDVIETGGARPALQMEPAWPNPFADETRIAFALVRPGRVSLSILDASGRRVATLVDEERDAGPHAARWDGRDDRGQRVAPGVYVSLLVSGGETRRGKVILVR